MKTNALRWPLLSLFVGACCLYPPNSEAICYAIYMQVMQATSSIPAYGTVTVTITGQGNTGTYTNAAWNPGGPYPVGQRVLVSNLQCLGPTTTFSGPRDYATWTITGHANDGSWYVYGSATLGGVCCSCDNCATPPGETDFFLDSADHSSGVGIANILASVRVPAMAQTAHNVQVEYNGVVVGSDITPIGLPAPYTANLTVEQTSAHNGDTYSLLIDGNVVNQGFVQLQNVGTTEMPDWQYTGDITGVVNGVGSGGGTPTPTPTPYGSATPAGTPLPVGTPPSVNAYHPLGSPGSTLYGQDVLVGNPQDIYGPITDKLSQLLDTSGLTEPIIQDADLSQRGHLDDLQGQMDSITGTIDGSVSDTTSQLGNIANSVTAGWSTSSFGSVTELDLPLNMIMPGMPSSIVVPPFAVTIRQIILWVLVACWYWMALRSIIALKPAVE